MQVQEYIFKSPYNNRVQIGIPEKTSQNDNQMNNIQNQQENLKIKNSEANAKIGDIKLTSDTNRLDVYA